MNAESFGKMIYKQRKKLGLTQNELAEKLSVSGKAISKWENGIGYPEITLLPALSKIFGIPVDYLLKGNPRGIAVAGNILVDVVNIIDKYPHKSMLANIISSENAVGGCVPNTIINLAKIDPELFLTAFGRVGNDEHGRYVTSQLKKYGVDTSRLITSDTSATGTSNVMTEKLTGDRTFFYLSGANSEFCENDIALESLDCEIFHIGYILLLDALDRSDPEYGTHLARLLAKIQKRGIKTSIDVVSEESERFAEKIIPALKYCNYVIMNEIECCSVSGLSPRNPDGSVCIENIRATMKAFIDYGVKDKVIIHCCEAGFCMDAGGEFVIVPSLVLPDGYIKGSVGAGDSYAAACLYGLYNGYGDKYLLEFASAAAACNLAAPDSISGMKSRAEIEKISLSYERRTRI